MSAWYREGKVNVSTGSQTVVGVGTKFIANCRVGDGFRGPDGGWYEVINVASETGLAIFPAYVGAAINNGTYMLAPLEGYVKESADRLRLLVEQFGDALIDLTGKTVVVTVAGVAADGTNNVPVAGLKTALGIDNLQPKEAGKGLSSNDYTTTEKNKLAGVAAGATANSSDATLVNRANHTGTQLAATISNFAASVLSLIKGNGWGLELAEQSVTTSDCNTALVTGIYRVSGSVLNKPTAAGGKLEVTKGFAATLFQEFSATDLSIWTRLSTNSGTDWTSWAPAVKAADIGTAAALTATTSTTDITTGRALRIGDHGTGAQVSPFIPDMDAPVANGYSWVTSGTLNQIVGWASGSQVLTFFASAAEVAQMFFSRTVPMRIGVRRKTTGTWQSMAELITSASAILDPALGTGGIISTAVVSGFRVDKYVNGTMCVTGKVSLASQAANSFGYQTLTLPVTFLNIANMVPGLTCNAQSTGDSYGVVFQRAASTSSILYAVRNGATAQAFEVNVQVWGTWK